MVEAGGIEPPAHRPRQEASAGQDVSSAGQNEAQVGQSQGDTEGAPVEERTEGGATPTPAGRSESTRSTQQEHNINTTGQSLPPDLARLMAAWPGLSQSTKQQIVELAAGDEASADRHE